VTPPALRRVVARPTTACALLLLAYLALSLLISDHGYIGGDTGGKVATLRAMEQRGALSPDVGYWAARWDPEGRLHPLFYTTHLDGEWVNVTTLPALYAGYPLFRLGGYRAALLVPMAGAVLAALAARALARRITGGEGWAAFWLVGLASPLTLYVLDFSEHSLGVALVAWGVVLLLDVAEGDRRWPKALAAGLLFGAAATMRTESLVYAAVATAGTGVVVLCRGRRIVGAVLAGGAVAAGLVIPLAANAALEHVAIGTGVRAPRTARALGSAVGDRGAGRVEEAALTGLSLRPRFGASSYLTGAVLLLALVLIARRASVPHGDPRLVVLALGGVGALYVLRAAQGLGFVPGLFAAAPLAAIGAARAWEAPGAKLIGGIALAALPLVWAFQYTGGMLAQWGGRYLLSSAFLLTVVAATALPRVRRTVALGLVAVAVFVTGFGGAWLSLRSHDVARSAAALARRPEPVLVSRVAFLAREDGWYANDHRWLTAVSAEDLREAARVVRDAGFDRFGLVEADETAKPVEIAGFSPSGSSAIEFAAGVDLRITTYARTG
jgi:hypothetical protein